MLDVVWRPRSQISLRAIIGYIADHDPLAAGRMLVRIRASVEPARVYPQLGRVGRAKGTREIIAHPNYLVIYRVLPDAIEVLNVIHARQKYP